MYLVSANISSVRLSMQRKLIVGCKVGICVVGAMVGDIVRIPVELPRPSTGISVGAMEGVSTMPPSTERFGSLLSSSKPCNWTDAPGGKTKLAKQYLMNPLFFEPVEYN